MSELNQAKQKSILICERFSLEALVKLKQNKGFLVENFSEEKLSSANGLIIRSKFKITRELLEKAPALEVIITCTSGYDHIDLVETKKRNICVMYTPDANVNSTAELTWGLILSANRKINLAQKEMKAGQWNRELFLANELSGKTLGIVGLGRIGSKVAKIAAAFEMKVLAFDPYQTDQQFTAAGAQRVSYEEVLKGSDVLSFHVPNTFETKNMFGPSQIEYVPPEIIIINASRGSVVNEEAVAEALNEKKIRFAAFDVYAKEPLQRDSKLLKTPNVVLTPHLGAYTEEAFLKASLEACERITQYFLKQKVLNSLPLQNDWGSLSFLERT